MQTDGLLLSKMLPISDPIWHLFMVTLVDGWNLPSQSCFWEKHRSLLKVQTQAALIFLIWSVIWHSWLVSGWGSNATMGLPQAQLETSGCKQVVSICSLGPHREPCWNQERVYDYMFMSQIHEQRSPSEERNWRGKKEKKNWEGREERKGRGGGQRAAP